MLSIYAHVLCENYLNLMQNHAHLEEEKLNLFIPLFLLLIHHAFLIAQLGGLNRCNCNINLMGYLIVISYTTHYPEVTFKFFQQFQVISFQLFN